MAKITTLPNIKQVSNAVKLYVLKMVGQVAEATFEAVEELENKLSKYNLEKDDVGFYIEERKED